MQLYNNHTTLNWAMPTSYIIAENAHMVHQSMKLCTLGNLRVCASINAKWSHETDEGSFGTLTHVESNP